MSENLTPEAHDELRAAVRRALRAAEGDSNDAEIDAWRSLADAALSHLGISLWSHQQLEGGDAPAATALTEPGAVTADAGEGEPFDISPWLRESTDDELVALSAGEGNALPARRLVARAQSLSDVPGDSAGIDEQELLAWICTARPHLRARLLQEVECYARFPELLDEAVESAKHDWLPSPR